MRQARSFLVVAEDPERLLLISQTLHRKFPLSVVQTCRGAESALHVAKAQKLDAIVAHRSSDLDEIPLLDGLRAVTRAPIVALTSSHQENAVRAGASRCLQVDQWLLIGRVVAELIGAAPGGP